jgi:hypothetical protein
MSLGQLIRRSECGYCEGVITRAQEVAKDWVWIVDHTVQIGEEKTVLIVGLRLSCLPAVGQPLRHEAVEPITLEPVKESTGEVEGVHWAGESNQGELTANGLGLACSAKPEK